MVLVTSAAAAMFGFVEYDENLSRDNFCAREASATYSYYYSYVENLGTR